MTETWPVLRLLNWCRDFFAGKGIDTPRLDAEVLLAHVLGVDRVGLYLRFDQPLQENELAAVRELVRRRGRREPVAHLVGTKEFFGLTFRVDRRVLTPRPDTEALVEAALAGLPADAPLTICEIGLGSGCVTAALAVKRPAWRFAATELSADALALAAENLARHGVAERVTATLGDLFGDLAGPFDAVVGNPPYLTTAELQKAMPEVAQYEPAAALDGGPDGLAVIRRLVAEAPERLRPGGLLALECGAGQAAAVAALFDETGRYQLVAIHKDLAGIDRVAAARRTER
jgi:release factor glutamine methyltransferase